MIGSLDADRGPIVTAPRGYMSEAERLHREVITLRRIICDARRTLAEGAAPPSEREAKALNTLHSLPIYAE